MYQYIGNNYWFGIKVVGNCVVENIQILLNKLVQIESNIDYDGGLVYLINEVDRDQWEDNKEFQYDQYIIDEQEIFIQVFCL